MNTYKVQKNYKKFFMKINNVDISKLPADVESNLNNYKSCMQKKKYK